MFILGAAPCLRAHMDDPATRAAIAEHSSFGLNKSFREFARLGWWPTHYGMFDRTMFETPAMVAEISEIVLDPRCTVQKFYLVGDHHRGQDVFPKAVQDSPKFVKFNYPQRPAAEKVAVVKEGTAGLWALRISADLGFSAVAFVGFTDSKYALRKHKEFARDPTHPRRWIVSKPLQSNPDHWFVDYHRVGDLLAIHPDDLSTFDDGLPPPVPRPTLRAVCAEVRTAHPGITLMVVATTDALDNSLARVATVAEVKAKVFGRAG